MAATVLNDLVKKYKQFVVNNAETLGHIESAARIVAYVAPGGSAALSELLSSAVSLVVLVNDTVLRTAANIKFNLPIPEKRIAFCLTIIDHVEVFLEIAAYGSGGNATRWLIVLVVQIIKAVLRFTLLYKYKCGIQPWPPVPALKRSKELLTRIKQQQTADEENNTERKTFLDEDCEDVSASRTATTAVQATFTLGSTGRSVRTLADRAGGSGDVRYSNTGESARLEVVPSRCIPTKLDDQQRIGETLHIARPLLHLLSMYICGESSWKPFLLACGVDLTSLCLMGEPSSLNSDEREELKRRTFVLLLYLLRSPFYDQYSKTRLLMLMGFMAKNIPGLRLIIRPLLEYLPIWQKIYFYVWMS